jgi:predicted dehydrogenase
MELFMADFPKSARVGIIGLGSIGTRHAKILLMNNIEVLGYDTSEQSIARAKSAGITISNRSEIKRHASHVIIATPNQHHTRDLESFVGFQMPILIEKPLGTNFSDSKLLVKKASEQNTPVFVAYNLRQRKVVKAILEILKKYDPETIISAQFHCGSYLPSWRPDTDYRIGYGSLKKTGGVVFDNIHEIDLALHIFGKGKLISSTLINTGHLEIESEDFASLVIKHKSGTISAITLDYLRQPAKRTIEILMSHGAIHVNLRTSQIKYAKADGTVKIEFQQDVDRDHEFTQQLSHFLHEKNWGKLCSGAEALGSLAIATEAKAASDF